VRSSVKSVLVILLLLSVITVFASPFVNLEPSALRAMRSADLLLAALALAGTVTFGLAVIVSWCDSVTGYESPGAEKTAQDLLKLNCARLC
jgi:hypothetical protein